MGGGLRFVDEESVRKKYASVIKQAHILCRYLLDKKHD